MRPVIEKGLKVPHSKNTEVTLQSQEMFVFKKHLGVDIQLTTLIIVFHKNPGLPELELLRLTVLSRSVSLS